MEITGKKAQEIHLKALTSCTGYLAWTARHVEENFSLIRQGQRKNKDNKVPLTEEIRRYILDTETGLAKLRALDKDNESIEYYKSKIKEWKAELQKAELKEEERRQATPMAQLSRMLSSYKPAIKKLENIRQTSRQEKSNEKIDINNTKQIVKALLDLSVQIESNGVSLTNNRYKAQRAEFDNNVMLLKTLEPDNPMLANFEMKQREWTLKRAKAVKGWRIAIVLTVILYMIALTIMISAESADNDSMSANENDNQTEVLQ